MTMAGNWLAAARLAAAREERLRNCRRETLLGVATEESYEFMA